MNAPGEHAEVATWQPLSGFLSVLPAPAGAGRTTWAPQPLPLCPACACRRRENNTGGFPRGLNQYLRALRFWLYGLSPFEPLQWEGPLVGGGSGAGGILRVLGGAPGGWRGPGGVGLCEL